jgi:glycosyltransferase involved in cell wall biosynthesis
VAPAAVENAHMQGSILFVSVMKGNPWGGCEELWARSAMRLAERGARVTTSVSYWPQPDSALDRLRAAGCRVDERNPRRAVSLALRSVGEDPNLWRAKRFIRSTRPDLVVISCGAFAEDIWWGEASRALGVAYVVVAQAAAEAWWPVGDARVQAIRSFYDGAVRVFFVSKGNRELVQRMLGARIPNARVIRNPFNVDYGVLCPYPPTDPTFNLACVARLEPYAKGQDLLIEVLSQPKWRVRNVAVRLYGKGPNANALLTLAELHQLHNVEFAGHINNIESLWRANHILVLPSRLEGLPLALVEAMLCARPAIVTDVAGNTEVIDDNETGFVAAAPTVAHLDEAMERAWQRRSEWEAMGAEAARRIRSKVPEDPIEAFVSEIANVVPTSARRQAGKPQVLLDSR